MKQDCILKSSKLLYLTRRVWRIHFSARPTYVCKWPGIRAQIHNVREKRYICIYRTTSFFSRRKKYIITSARVSSIRTLMEF